MATKQSTIDFLLDQLSAISLPIRTKKMFGEYALYCDEKVVALVCDDKLFIKPTEEGREYIGTPEEAPPYPGAKLYFLITPDDWEEKERLGELIMITASALPYPKPKKKKLNEKNKI